MDLSFKYDFVRRTEKRITWFSVEKMAQISRAMLRNAGQPFSFELS